MLSPKTSNIWLCVLLLLTILFLITTTTTVDSAVTATLSQWGHVSEITLDTRVDQQSSEPSRDMFGGDISTWTITLLTTTHHVFSFHNVDFKAGVTPATYPMVRPLVSSSITGLEYPCESVSTDPSTKPISLTCKAMNLAEFHDAGKFFRNLSIVLLPTVSRDDQPFPKIKITNEVGSFEYEFQIKPWATTDWQFNQDMKIISPVAYSTYNRTTSQVGLGLILNTAGKNQDEVNFMLSLVPPEGVATQPYQFMIHDLTFDGKNTTSFLGKTNITFISQDPTLEPFSMPFYLDTTRTKLTTTKPIPPSSAPYTIDISTVHIITTNNSTKSLLPVLRTELFNYQNRVDFHLQHIPTSMGDFVEPGVPVPSKPKDKMVLIVLIVLIIVIILCTIAVMWARCSHYFCNTRRDNQHTEVLIGDSTHYSSTNLG